MINILFHSNYPQAKMGGQKSLVGLIENLDRERFNPMLVVHENGELAELLKKIGAKTFIFKFPGNKPKNFFKVRKSIKQFSNILMENKIDIVHSDNDKFIYLASKSAKKADTKSIYHARVTSKRRYDQLLEKNVDQIVGISNGVKGRFSKKTLNNKFVKIYNGVNLEKFNSNYNLVDIREKLNLDKDKFIIVFAGQLVENKGMIEILKAAEILNTENNLNIKFYILGDEQIEGKKQKFIQLRDEMNLNNTLSFEGQVNNIDEWIKSSDVFILPSYEEGMGRVAIEAMACQKPVVATDIPGLNEAVNKESGILIKPQSYRELADAILKLYNDKDLASQKGQAGEKRALELFDIKVHAENMMNLFEKMVNENEN